MTDSSINNNDREDLNPYAVISVEQEDPLNQSESGRFRMDQFEVLGLLLLCGPTLVLPPVCPFTGETDDLVAVRSRPQYPSMKLVQHQRTCEVTFFITSRMMRKQRQRQIIYFILMLVGFELLFSLPLLTSLSGLNLLGNFTEFGQFIGAVWIFICINAIQHNFLRLVLTRFEKPDSFWIRGFKETHLQRFLDCREALLRSAHQRKTQSS